MSTISERIDAIKDLIRQREEIDRKLENLFNGGGARKAQKCGHCGQEGHNAKSCPNKGAPPIQQSTAEHVVIPERPLPFGNMG